MVKYISLLFLLTVTSSCNQKKLVTPLKENLSGLINLNGYYFLSKKVNNEDYSTIFFLYKTGVVYNFNSYPTSKKEELEKLLKEDLKVYKEKFNPMYIDWGIYLIANNNIEYETWYSGSGGKLPVLIKKGKVLNDSTFIFTSIEKQNGKNRKVIDETYHFRQFSPKPDSTNKFIN